MSTSTAEFVSEAVPHPVARECWGRHCFAHDVDELPQPGDFLVCGECFHIYRTETDLIVADRMHAAGLHEKEGFRDPKQIYACPLCAHDF